MPHHHDVTPSRIKIFYRNKDMNESTFYLIPLPLIKDLIRDGNTIHKMCRHGLYWSAMKTISSDLKEACRDFISCAYRCKDELSIPLREELPNLIPGIISPGNEAFDENGEFLAEDGINSVILYCDSHQKFQGDLMEWCKLREFYKANSLKMTDIGSTIEQARGFIQKVDTSSLILFRVSTEVMDSLVQNAHEFTADDRAMWAMYLGILSIIGNKDFVQTTSSMIKSRMFGARSTNEMKQYIEEDPSIENIFKKFTSPYRYSKYLDNLQYKDMIKELGYNRRTYVSIKANSITELGDMIYEKETAARAKKERNREKEITREKLRNAFNATFNASGKEARSVTTPVQHKESTSSSSTNNKECPTIKSSQKNASLRKNEFYESLVPFIEKYSKDMIDNFFNYWSEFNRSGTKMRFELQKTWEVSLRLSTWARREKQSLNNKGYEIGMLLTDNSIDKFKDEQGW